MLNFAIRNNRDSINTNMDAASLQVTQNNLIREILGITDINVLERLEQFLRRDKVESYGGVVAEEPCMGKTEILSHIDQACKEYQLIKQGKLKAISKEELLYDL